MQVILHKGQLEVAEDPHRYRILCCGRRWGKSVLSRLILLKWALEKPGLYWIVSPTYRQGKQNHWRAMQQEIPRSIISKKNEVELSITLQNGSVLELKGADNPDSLRGVKLSGLVVDEIASIRDWDWLWEEVLRPTLTDYESPALFLSTPKGFNHFFDLYQRGTGNESSYKSWRFTSYDNPYIPSREIDEAKKELTENTFAQEYLADFRKFTGIIYKEFDRHLHIIDPFDIPDSWEIYRGIDFGSTNPTACLWIATDGDYNFFVIDEHYSTQGMTIDTHAGIINANPYSKRVVQTFGDPSGPQWMSEFEWRGIYITPADKTIRQEQGSWVRLGIEKVSEFLHPKLGHEIKTAPEGVFKEGDKKFLKGVPSLFVFSNCTNTIREFENYRWKEKAQGQEGLNAPDQPEKADDHAMDALRYFIVSYKKQLDTVVNDFSQWRI